MSKFKYISRVPAGFGKGNWICGKCGCGHFPLHKKCTQCGIKRQPTQES